MITLFKNSKKHNQLKIKSFSLLSITGFRRILKLVIFQSKSIVKVFKHITNFNKFLS